MAASGPSPNPLLNPSPTSPTGPIPSLAPISTSNTIPPPVSSSTYPTQQTSSSALPPKLLPPTRRTSNTPFPPPPLPPSIEKAYYRKCIALKRRLNEIEEANDVARLKKIRLKRAVLKLRLERGFLLKELERKVTLRVEGTKRAMSGNNSAGNGDGSK